jgi:RNA polymerase sigma-70 factor (ECF subfamily)
MSNSTIHTQLLFESLGGQLRHFIRSRVNDYAEAEDILQDVFLKIHTNIDSLNDESKLERWVYQIARNAIIDRYRSKKPGTGIDEIAETLAEAHEEETAEQKLLPCVREFVDQLPEPYREALKLVEYEGISQKEFAERVGISVSGAKSRVQRARAMVRELLLQCCHFEFDRYGTVIDYHPIDCAGCATSEERGEVA